MKKLITGNLNKNNLVFFVIFCCVLMQILDWGSAYRFFAYLNMLLVLMFGFTQYKKKPSSSEIAALWCLLLIPLALIAIHFLAVENIKIIKEIRHIFVAIFLALGIWMLAKRDPDYIKNNIFTFLLILIFSYVLIQAIALWYFQMPYGTTKNPHYLAVYSALTLIATIFCFLKASSKTLKTLLVMCGLCLGFYLLHSSSRPTWIGLIISAFVILFFVDKRTQLVTAATTITILIALTLANVGNFATRSGELLANLNTEERVVIWRDTWRMQTQSTTDEWLIGHGINSFEADFKPYSYYHLQNIDFNSPHNFFLELLYISGIAGLFLAVSLFWIIYRNLIISIKSQASYKNIYLLLLTTLTINLILVSITLPFFMSFNLNMIAMIFGVMLYLKEIESNSTQ